MSDERTRDLLRNGSLGVRARLGERTLRRVGGRQWDRPNVFVSEALYKRCGLADPWSPDGGEGRDGIGLGPVSLRLGEPKRQPAPHLRPKEPKAKKQADPLSKWRRPAASASPSPSPSRSPAPSPRATAAAQTKRKPASPASPASPVSSGAAKDAVTPDTKPDFVPTPDRVERGMFRNKVKRGLKAPIPVRPELRNGGSAAPSKASHAPRSPAKPPAPKAPAASRPPARPSRQNRRGRLAARPRQRAVELGGPEVVEVARAAPTPSVVDLGPPEVLVDAEPRPAPAATAPPVDRRPPGRPMGLDDLFGGSTEGRVRMRRRSAENPTDEPTEV